MTWSHPWVDELLHRWGDWVRMEKRARLAQSRYDGMPPEPSEVVRSWVPLDELECCETDAFVTSLAEPWRSVVNDWYLSDASVESKARSLQMSTRTLYVRVREVHQRYLRWHVERREKAEASAAVARAVDRVYAVGGRK
jgi:hypothetical protein